MQIHFTTLKLITLYDKKHHKQSEKDKSCGGEDTDNSRILSRTYSRILRNHKKNTYYLIEIWAEDRNLQFTQEEIQMANKHMFSAQFH